MDAEETEIPTEQLRDRIKCSTCQKKLTDPRMLPCIHTFCLGCLNEMGSKEEKKPGDDMSCPICRTQFTIPPTGFSELQKNLFLERLIEMEQVSDTTGINVPCDICSTIEAEVNDETTFAVKYCLVCRDKLCSDCAKHHQKQKLSRDHVIVDIGSEMKEENLLNKSVKENCGKHPTKPLETYCTDCYKVVCVLCFLKDHERHKGMDIPEAEEEFRQEIERDYRILDSCELGILEKKTILQKECDEFLQRMSDIENSIVQTGQELKESIDKQAEALTKKARKLKAARLKKFQEAITEIDSYLSLMTNYKVTCDEVKAFGFPTDICRLENALRHRAYELIEKHNNLCNTNVPTNISLKAVDTSFSEEEFGTIQEQEDVLHLFVICPGSGNSVSKDIFDVSLSSPDSKTNQSSIPTAVQAESAAVIHENIIFVTGIGSSSCEIWKSEGLTCPFYYGWNRCKDMYVSRCGHCVAFTKEQLYMIGGYKLTNENVLDSVVAYDPKANSCRTAGKLVHGVQYAACVAWKDSIYVFGGSDMEKTPVDLVQVYNTTDDTCSVLSTPMPSPQSYMRAALCNEKIILLGSEACFIFDLVAEVWLKRVQFKTDVVHFGLALHNDRIIVFGGGKREENQSGTSTWACRDDIRYVPLLNFISDIPTDWKILGKLPRKCMIHAYGSKTIQKVTHI